MLRRVVNDVFNESVGTFWSDSVTEQGIVQVTLSPTHLMNQRVVELSASSTGVFEICFPELDFRAGLFEYSDGTYMEDILRQLALVADAYLSGAGRLEHRQGLFKRKAVLKIDVGGNEWAIGRHGGTVFYPDEDPGHEIF